MLFKSSTLQFRDNIITYHFRVNLTIIFIDVSYDTVDLIQYFLFSSGCTETVSTEGGAGKLLVYFPFLIKGRMEDL